MRIAFAGNPNSGKTTMYNALTGRNEKVGNWAGVTVAKNAYELVQKLLRFAASRGFESSLALECTRALLHEDADDALDAFDSE